MRIGKKLHYLWQCPAAETRGRIGAVRHDREGSLCKPEPRLQRAGLSLGIAFAMTLLVLKEGMFLHQEAGRGA